MASSPKRTPADEFQSIDGTDARIATGREGIVLRMTPPRVILVVEDNPITRKMLRLTLESDGYVVIETAAGSVALESVVVRRPDLVVLDYVLPDTDGVELLGELRDRMGLPNLPALIVTGMVTRLEELRGRGLKSTEFLAKPVEPWRLLAMVRAYLAPLESRGRARRVLVVDDDPFNLKLTELRLQQAGYRVETASSGAEGLRKARARPPEVMLSDVLMPTMDGFAFCSEARRDRALAGIPVVLSSAAYVESGDRELARKLGANALVIRGPQFEEVLEALEESLRAGAPPAPVKVAQYAALHSERLQIQLSRQIAENDLLARKTAIQATALAVVRGLSEVVAQPRDVSAVIGNVLVQCLDATGISKGLLYLIESDGSPKLQAQFGMSVHEKVDAESCFGRPKFLQRVADGGRPVAIHVSARDLDPLALEFLSCLDQPWGLCVPFAVAGVGTGILVLASDSHDLSEVSWLLFAQSVATQFGQAVALGHSLARLAASESKLLQAQKMESVGRLAGGVAHDFNNLLGVIIGYGQLLRRRLPKDPELEKYVDDILNAGERAAGLTRQLLAFSRRQVLQPRTLDLNVVVVEVEKMLRRLIRENIQITTSLDPNPAHILADAGQLEQVLMNLVVNARDAMPRGGHLMIKTGTVQLDAKYTAMHPEVLPGCYAMLAVSDTGHGMTTEVQAQVFEPFYTTKEAGKGTGLGLATVHGIVKQSGGHIFVYSEPGRGSTFKVYLPTVAGELERETAVSEEGELPRGTETVLIAEDESALREIVRECLEASGYTVLQAADGGEAMRLSDRHEAPIHLLVTDVVMPGMGGSELAGLLSAHRPGIRVLYMSGYTDDAVVVREVTMGGAPFLEKPFTAGGLVRKVRDVLDRS